MAGYLIGGAMTALAAILGFFLLTQHRRIRKLAEQTEDYLNGQGQPLSFSLREDSFASLENAMAELEERLEGEREHAREEARRTSDLTADISHQLKTPLASLRLFVEMDESVHMAQEISQIERMETLISSLLRLEKLCADGYPFTFGDHSLRQLTEDAWAALRPVWPEKRVEIIGDAIIRCDAEWMTEAMLNLLKNACEHTRRSGEITVRMERTDRAAFCTVEDDGGGVPEPELMHLFDRFYRAESHKSSGVGLGLAIVKEIIFRHHGHIAAENTWNGLRFSISLPVQALKRSAFIS